MQRKIIVSKRLLLFLWVALISGLLPGRAAASLQAAGPLDCNAFSSLEWKEKRSRNFAVLYALPNVDLGQAVTTLAAGQFDAEYERLAAVFNVSLSLPATIRLYPDERAYVCLNPQVPELAPGATHSHLGQREIALVAENIQTDPATWMDNGLEIFRYEVAQLFVEQISGARAPVGLGVAVGYYAQDPLKTQQPLHLQPGEWLAPTREWTALWEDPETSKNFHLGLQAASTAAYLIDGFGWQKFLRFLQELRTAAGYRQALSAVYAIALPDLQAQWREYFPLYFQQRYLDNVLYNFDLGPYDKLLKAGAYSDAASGLLETLAFLQKSGQDQKAQLAQQLMERAQRGQEAGLLAAQSRLALLQGDYTHALQQVEQARHQYALLGNFTRLDELDAYRAQLEKILFLHTELDIVKDRLSIENNPFVLAERLLELQKRSAELGDLQGQVQVRQMGQVVQNRQRVVQTLLGVVGAGLALILLGARIWMIRYKPAPEAQL